VVRDNYVWCTAYANSGQMKEGPKEYYLNKYTVIATLTARNNTLSSKHVWSSVTVHLEQYVLAIRSLYHACSSPKMISDLKLLLQ